MNTTAILHKAETEHAESEKSFFSFIAYTLLEESEIFSLLDGATEIGKHLLPLFKEKKTLEKVHNPFDKSNPAHAFREKLDSLSLSQQQILSCPHTDEHVLLLASLKALEELGETNDYKIVLKEILVKNLHKVSMTPLSHAFIGRKKEQEEILRALSRNTRNSVLLIGSGGIGKTTLAQAMLQKFSDKKTYQLYSGNASFLENVVSLQSGAKGKALFFLDEAFSFDSTQIKYLVDNAQFIATANDTAFKKFSTEQPGIVSKLEVIQLEEPSISELREILIMHQAQLTKQHPVTFSETTLEDVISLAKQYMLESFFPAKGILLLEEAALLAVSQNAAQVTSDMVRSIVSQKTNVPVDSLTEFDKKDLSLLPNKLSEKVKGQEDAVSRVSRVVQRSKLGFGKRNKPIGSFLFLGPSGVGKTELAKAVAQSVFGGEEHMIRIDMSEFAESHNVQRLIGAPPGYIGFEEGGQLTNPVKAKPYNLILLDEIEKAHPRVFDIFLQVLDDGRLTDGQGKVVDFRNTIIIATSNAGIEDILDLIQEGKSHDEIASEVKEILTDYFRIEFINRFDDIIIFNALTPDALVDIAKLQIEKLTRELAKRSIGFSVSPETLQQIATESHDPRYGARGLLRFLQDRIENTLAEMIINGELKEGQTIAF